MGRTSTLSPPPESVKAENSSKKSKQVLQDRVWQSLSELCQKMDNLENKPFGLGSANVGSAVDISTSFLRTEHDYDWFDLDKDGGIVLQPKVPMFPEDFPPGQPLHPLSWWGIIDPAVGERKNPKVVTASGVERVIEKMPNERKRDRSIEKMPDKRKRDRSIENLPDERKQDRSIEKMPDERKRDRSIDRQDKKPPKKRSRSRSRDRNEANTSGRRGRGEPPHPSPDVSEQHSHLRNGPPPPLPPPPPPPRRGDPYGGPPRDDRPPVLRDGRWMGDWRSNGPPGGDRGYSDDRYPPVDDRQRYPDDRGRYGGVRHPDELPRQDERGHRRGRRPDDF